MASKVLRFEVFKRDSFKCQYWGRAPPEVVLEVDHIVPRAEGGKDNINNYITACGIYWNWIKKPETRDW